MKKELSSTLPRLTGFFKKYSLAAIALTALLTLVFAVSLRDLGFEDVRGSFDIPDDDPVSHTLSQFESQFDAGETLILTAEYDSLWGLQQIQDLEILVSRLRELDGVIDIYAPSTAKRIYWIPTAISYRARLGPLYPLGTADSAGIDRLRNLLASEPAFAQNLISKDGRSLAIAIELKARSSQEEVRKFVVTLNTLLPKAPHVRYRLVGAPLIDLAFADIHRRDLRVFGAVSFLSVVLVLVFFFRRWKPILLALLVAFLSLIWSLAALSLTGKPLSAGLAMIIPLVLVNSIAYAIHYLEFYFQHERKAKDRDQAFSQMVQAVFRPSVLAGLTTAIGFFSLSVSSLRGVEEMGLYLSIGILASAFLNNIFLVSLLYRLKPSNQRPLSTYAILSLLSLRAGTFVQSHAKRILWGAAVLIIAAIVGTVLLRVDTNHLAYLHSENQLRSGFTFVDQNFGGTIPLEITVTVPQRNLDTAILEISRLEEALRSVAGIGSVVSIVDIIDMAAKIRPRVLGGPTTASTGTSLVPASFWESYHASTSPTRYLVREDSIFTFRVSSRLHAAGSRHLEALLASVQGDLDLSIRHGTAKMTGLAVYFSRLNSYILDSQFKSFGTALMVTLLLLMLVSRSWRLGLLAILANILPILTVLGFMGWVGVPLDIATIMVASVTMGIVVDATIHFLFRYRHEMRQTRSPTEAIKASLTVIGSPILIIAVVQSLGFFSLVPSRFVPFSHFGILSGLTVLVAIVADMLMLPAMIQKWQKWLVGTTPTVVETQTRF